jgi:hypothetical protein
MSTRRWFRQPWFADALAVGVLGVIAWTIAGSLVRDDVFIYGDHAGHYWIFWYTLNVAAPLHHRLIDWIPYWYAGYPDLQFTPPGYVLLGWLLNLITLARFPTALLYAIVSFIGYALPGVTFFYAIRHLGFDRRAAFSAGLLGLVFPAFFGGAVGLFIGMIGSRLAFALDALLFVWTIDLIEGRGARYAGLAALALAAVILAHPYHAIGIMVALGLYILVRRLPMLRAIARLSAIIAIGCALNAFWLAPLLAHSSSAMLPVLRATFDQTWAILSDAILLPYAILALPMLVCVWRKQDQARRAIPIVLIALPMILGASMLTIHRVLIEQFRVYQIDPIRLIGEYYLAFIWLAALGISEISTWFSGWAGRKIHSPVSAWSVTLLTTTLFLIPTWQATTYFQPQTEGEPRFLSQAIRDYRLDELWATLRATEGRVLFTSYDMRLSARGVGDFDTTLAALTPLFTNRQMMGGTYSHWSPIAALMWVGDTNPPVLQGRVEEQDDRALFGVPLEKLSDTQVYDYCRRFNITTIVASVNDFHTRTFLDVSPRFQSYYDNGYFFVYRVKEYESAWIDAQNAVVDLLSFADDEITLRVRAAQANASVRVKVYAYPLWRATTDRGETLTITPDETALIQITLPPRENYTVTLRYMDGLVEQLGNWISIVSWGLSGGVIVFALIYGKFTRVKNQPGNRSTR